MPRLDLAAGDEATSFASSGTTGAYVAPPSWLTYDPGTGVLHAVDCPVSRRFTSQFVAMNNGGKAGFAIAVRAGDMEFGDERTGKQGSSIHDSEMVADPSIPIGQLTCWWYIETFEFPSDLCICLLAANTTSAATALRSRAAPSCCAPALRLRAAPASP